MSCLLFYFCMWSIPIVIHPKKILVDFFATLSNNCFRQIISLGLKGVLRYLKVAIRYRVDKRIKVAEIRSGSKLFLTDLDVFIVETGINDFSESHMGNLSISTDVFKTLWEGRVTYAKPESFRFRKNEGNAEKV